MAKDGTARGGRRTGAGRKKEKMTLVTDAVAVKVGKVPAFMTRRQADGEKIKAKQIYEKTMEYLKSVGVEDKVNAQTVEEYAMAAARWIQCEEAVSRLGLIGKHPTTGADIVSPYVTMAQSYAKQMNAAWYNIDAVVRAYGSSIKMSDADEMLMGLLAR